MAPSVYLHAGSIDKNLFLPIFIWCYNWYRTSHVNESHYTTLMVCVIHNSRDAAIIQARAHGDTRRSCEWTILGEAVTCRGYSLCWCAHCCAQWSRPAARGCHSDRAWACARQRPGSLAAAMRRWLDARPCCSWWARRPPVGWVSVGRRWWRPCWRGRSRRCRRRRLGRRQPWRRWRSAWRGCWSDRRRHRCLPRVASRWWPAVTAASDPPRCGGGAASARCGRRWWQRRRAAADRRWAASWRRRRRRACPLPRLSPTAAADTGRHSRTRLGTRRGCSTRATTRTWRRTRRGSGTAWGDGAGTGSRRRWNGRRRRRRGSKRTTGRTTSRAAGCARGGRRRRPAAPTRRATSRAGGGWPRRGRTPPRPSGSDAAARGTCAWRTPQRRTSARRNSPGSWRLRWASAQVGVYARTAATLTQLVQRADSLSRSASSRPSGCRCPSSCRSLASPGIQWPVNRSTRALHWRTRRDSDTNVTQLSRFFVSPAIAGCRTNGCRRQHLRHIPCADTSHTVFRCAWHLDGAEIIT